MSISENWTRETLLALLDSLGLGMVPDYSKDAKQVLAQNAVGASNEWTATENCWGRFAAINGSAAFSDIFLQVKNESGIWTLVERFVSAGSIGPTMQVFIPRNTTWRIVIGVGASSYHATLSVFPCKRLFTGGV